MSIIDLLEILLITVWVTQSSPGVGALHSKAMRRKLKGKRIRRPVQFLERYLRLYDNRLVARTFRLLTPIAFLSLMIWKTEVTVSSNPLFLGAVALYLVCYYRWTCVFLRGALASHRLFAIYGRLRAIENRYGLIEHLRSSTRDYGMMKGARQYFIYVFVLVAAGCFAVFAVNYISIWAIVIQAFLSLPVVITKPRDVQVAFRTVNDRLVTAIEGIVRRREGVIF